MTLRHVIRLTLLMCTAGGLGLGAQQGTPRQNGQATLLPPAPQMTSRSVTDQDLLAGLKDQTRWLTFSGDYNGQRHSPSTQLTPQNIAGLVPQWMFQTDIAGFPGRGIETTPLVIDGVMYVTGNNNQAWALDARTGVPIWRYRRTLPANFSAFVCCGPVNRGFAILGDRLYMGTLDSHLVALDRKTGSVIWDVEVGDLQSQRDHARAAGREGQGDRRRRWRRLLEPRLRRRVRCADWRARLALLHDSRCPARPGGNSWPNQEVALRGGGAVWNSGSYDPALNLVFFGTGNPNPDYYGDDREGDNLYTCSLVALDADTGKLRWHYQFTPHDVHDWDSAHVPVLADLTIGGQPRKVIMVANRNGFFYTIDRETGKLLVGKPFISTNWAREIDKAGRPIVLDNLGTPEKCLPDNHGGTNFQPPSFDPSRRSLFRDRARDLRGMGAEATCTANQAGRPRAEWRPATRRGARPVCCAPSHRPDDRRDSVGTSVPAVSVHGVSRPLRRDPVDCLRAGVHWRQRWLLPRVRCADGEGALALSDRGANLGVGADQLRARRPPVGRDHVRVIARCLRAASSVRAIAIGPTWTPSCPSFWLLRRPASPGSGRLRARSGDRNWPHGTRTRRSDSRSPAARASDT